MLSCKSEPDVIYTADNVHGYWEMVKARRNGKVTNTLNGAWIKIKGNEMMDNFFSNETKYEFQLENNNLKHLSQPSSRDYKVIFASQDTLKLSTVHNKFKFDFILKKVAD